MNLNILPPSKFVIIDISPQFHWTLTHKLNPHLTRTILEFMVRTYPEINFLDDIWSYIENQINVHDMSVVQLENLEFELEQLCTQVDNYIHQTLKPYEYDYRFIRWIEPWSIVMEYRG